MDISKRVHIGVAAVLTVWSLHGLPGGAGAAPSCFGKPATIVGTDGDDTIVGTAGPDVIMGRGGLDVIQGLGGNDRICGGSNRSRDGWRPVFEQPIGGHGADMLDGDGGPDALRGGPGDDRLFLGTNPGVSSQGEQVRELAIGGVGDDHLSGGPGRDNLDGGGGDDVLRGGPEGDVFAGPLGHDRAYGGAGFDVLTGAGDGSVEFWAGPGDDVAVGGNGGDVLRGEEGDDFLAGAGGDDAVIGDAGDDTLAGADGDDRLAGGPGLDLVDFRYTYTDTLPRTEEREVRVNLGAGVATGVGLDTLIDLEGAIGEAGNDTLIGDEEPNVLSLGDVGIGTGADDLIDGRGGADTLAWGGNSPFGRRCCQEMTVDLGQGTASSGTTAALKSIENVDPYLADGYGGGNNTIIGDNRPNTLRGGGVTDVVRGLGGNDIIDGRAGDDNLDGGAGHNVINGGAGHDTCTNPSTGPNAVNCNP